VRSLDASAERLDRVLEVLVQAGRALTNHAELRDALAEFAGALVDDFGDYCEIDVFGLALERERFKVSAGTALDSPDQRRRIVERIGDGRRTLGRITCTTASPDGFDDLTRKALQVLANELGVALGGKVLMRREHRVADRLQRALLPEHLPAMPGAQFHAAYRPASDEAEVGGDWFDAFVLADRRVAISIGDVAGHGLEAAVIMGEVRQAIRTAAVAADSPAAVLDYVNRIITLRESIGMVTAIVGIYDPETSRLSYAVAGHPAPIIALENGLVRRLPSGSLPLGCVESLECYDWTFTLPQGAHAIFYTDGLIENERDLINGEKRLAEEVRSLALEWRDRTPEAPDPALAVQERIFNGGFNRDDAAVLLLSRTNPVPSYVFSAVPVAATLTRAIACDEMARLGIEKERRFGMLVAIGEAVANAIEHAYRGAAPGLIRIELAKQERQLLLSVEDFGHWRPFVRREDRGRGIELMHAFMDGVQIRSTRESTRILLRAAL
jgi:anti-sigma regulatory factor (Ser/Thr protein kinase)